MKGAHEAFPGYVFKQTPTMIEGGVGESIVPDQASVLIDARLLPNQKNEDYIKAIQILAHQFNSKKINFKIEIKTNAPGVAISPQEKIVQILSKLDGEVMGVKPEIKGSGATSDGYMFIKAGIPTICGFGAKGANFHATDEYVELDSLSGVLEIYIRAALKLFSKK